MLLASFQRGLSINPDGICVTDGTRSLTYREVDLLSGRIAGALRRDGFTGSVAGVYGYNHLLTCPIVIGILKAGCIWMAINTRNAHEEVLHSLKAHDAAFLFYHSGLGEIVEAIVPQLFQLRARVEFETAALERWLNGVAPATPHEAAPDETIAIRSTGGTTGLPKGVMTTGRVYATMMANMLACLPFKATPVHLAAAPLSHGAGILCFPTMVFGGVNVVLDRPRPDEILESIARHRVSFLFLPPTMVYMLLESPVLSKFDYRSLEYLIYSGAPMSADKLRTAIAAFGPVMAQGFGQSEAPFFCTILTPKEHFVEGTTELQTSRLESCGRAAPFVRVATMDEEGRLLPPLERGEIVVRGDIVMKGYYKNPEATAEVSKYGWHHTGDIGYFDAEGYLFIVDRKRDIIISGGFNISATEVERVLLSHPGVSDCAVVGVPDEKWGESVKAIVERRAGAAISAEELLSLCRERLGGMKTPKSLEFWKELPRSSIGKVLKREIRDTFWSGHKRMV